MLDQTLTILLAGGAGARLHPLTADRAKPAVPFGGKYRIIDFTLTNCLHSGLRRVLVLTQYKSHSLQKHLRDGWSIFNPECGEYITAVPPQMRTGDSWYVGTADAIFQNLYLLERSGAERVLILSGDHIYRMDYAAMIAAHMEKRADLTVACMKVPLADASSFGIVLTSADERIVDFQEKPRAPQPMADDRSAVLASMGIYIFARDVLADELIKDHDGGDSNHDFGKDIIPRLIHSHSVFSYRFGGVRGRVTPDQYWRDVGTIDAFYDANMDLLRPRPPLNLYQDDWPIRTYQPQNPPAHVVSSPNGKAGSLVDSIVGDGCVLAGGIVKRSILSSKVRVEENAALEGCVIFDDVIIGQGAKLGRCIVDKHVRVPAGETIGIDLASDARRFTVSEKGIVVVPRGYKFVS